MSEPISTVILCGGKGTRLRALTEAMPKPLVEIGDKPILWHIMRNYSQQGFNRFHLALGHLGNRIEEYFTEHREPWSIDFADTGVTTQTGGRIKRMESRITGDTFFATYGDGLSDIDFSQLLDFHHRHGRIATVTVVRPRLNFGLVNLNQQGLVTSFLEKPVLESWVSGGFFVFDRRIFDHLTDEAVLETGPLRTLAEAGQLTAYQHEGFWRCMDTYKDHAELNQLWTTGDAPWSRIEATP